MYYFASTDGMVPTANDPVMAQICDLFRQAGVVANCSGFFYTTFSVWLVVQEPQRLELVTKWLYPDVARHYGTNGKAVITGIRRIIADLWEKDPARLARWAGCQMTRRPTPTEFLGIVASRVRESLSE